MEIRSTTAQLSHTRSGHEATTAGWIFIALISKVDEHCAATSCLWQYHSACIAQLATTSKGVLVPKFNTMEKSMKNIMQMSRVSVHNKKNVKKLLLYSTRCIARFMTIRTSLSISFSHWCAIHTFSVLC